MNRLPDPLTVYRRRSDGRHITVSAGDGNTVVCRRLDRWGHGWRISLDTFWARYEPATSNALTLTEEAHQ